MIALLGLLGCIAASDVDEWQRRTRVTGPFIALSTAGDRNCALGTSGGDEDEQGNVVCWGRDDDDLLASPSTFAGTLLALGGDTACVAGEDGYDCTGMVTPSSGSESPAAIRAIALNRDPVPYDDGAMCLSTDAITTCIGWESKDAYETYATFDESFDTIALGGGHFVGLRGQDMYQSLIGGLPTDETTNILKTDTAVDVAFFGSQRLLLTGEAAELQTTEHDWPDLPGAWTAGDIGDDWACVTDGGPITCFGNAPVDGISGRYVDVGVGNSHVCGLTDDGHIVCEGDDRYGQAGEPPFSEVTGG